jgi:hypothetical protein
MNTPAIKDKMLVSRDTFNAHRFTIVRQKVTLASAAWNYDVAAILGPVETAKCDLTKTEIIVDVLDTDVDSTTYDYYIDAKGVATVGYKEDGKVRVVNLYPQALSFIIRVVCYRKPL